MRNYSFKENDLILIFLLIILWHWNVRSPFFDTDVLQTVRQAKYPRQLVYSKVLRTSLHCQSQYTQKIKYERFTLWWSIDSTTLSIFFGASIFLDNLSYCALGKKDVNFTPPNFQLLVLGLYGIDKKSGEKKVKESIGYALICMSMYMYSTRENSILH